MKFVLALLFMFSISGLAQEPKAYLDAFDNRIYSLKGKGVKDLVVDIESSKLTKQMNDQMIFGKVSELFFRVFWTSNPERLEIEVHGLPEGFKEIKEELKQKIFSIIDNLIPIGIHQRFAGHKFTAGYNAKEFIAQDQSGIASITSYVLKFDANDKLTEIIGNRPIGTFKVNINYTKEGFSDGKWVLRSQKTMTADNGQELITQKSLDYGSAQGMGVLTSVKFTTEQKFEKSDAGPAIVEEETLVFKNYKINSGEALKNFLSTAQD